MTDLLKTLARHKLVRYAFSGASALAVEEIGLFLFHGQLGWPLWVATTIAFGSAFALNFFLNRVFTFAEDGAREGKVQGQTVRFAILVGINFFVTQGAMYLLTGAGINYLIAKVMATAIITVYNFYIYKKWVFKAPAKPAGAAAPAAAQDAPAGSGRIRA